MNHMKGIRASVRRAACALLALAMLAGPAAGASSGTEGAASDNAGSSYDYGNYASPDSSALYQEGDNLVRVEHIGDRVLVER